MCSQTNLIWYATRKLYRANDILSYLSSLHDLIAKYNVDVGGFAGDNQFYTPFKSKSESEAEALNETASCINAIREWML